MDIKLCIVVCENFSSEAELAVKGLGLADINIASFPARCRNNNSNLKLGTDLSEFDYIDVIGTECCSKFEITSNCRVHCFERCFQLIVQKPISDYFLQQKACLLTPGWLKNWKKTINACGFDDSNAKLFFGEFSRKLVLLDTGNHKEYSDALRELGEFVGLPVEKFSVGIGCLADIIEKIYLKRRLEAEKLKNQNFAAAKKRLAEYAMINELKEMYCRLFENSPVPMVVFDLDGRYLLANQAAAELFGYTEPEALIGKSVFDHVHPESVSLVPKRIKQLIDQEKPAPIKRQRFIKANGLTIDVNSIAMPFKLQGNTAIYTVFQDISAQKQMEEFQRINEEFFRGAFDYAAVGMGIGDLHGRYIRVNQAFCDMLGYTKNKLYSSSIQDMIHPEDVEMNLNGINQLATGKIDVFQTERRYIHKKGHIVWTWINTSVIKDLEGKPLYLISQAQDITDQKRVAHALEQSEKKFRLLFDDARDPMTLIKVDENGALGEVLEANKAAIKLFGNLVGKDTKEVVKTSLLEGTIYNVINSEDGKTTWEATVRVNEETAIPYEFSSQKIWLDGQEVVFTVARNIFKRKVAKNLLKEVNKKLEAANKELVRIGKYKTEFLNNLTHEFKSPLTAILILTRELLSKSLGNLNLKQEEYLRDIEDSSRQLLDMINDLLELAKVESGKIGLNLSEVKVGSIAFEVIRRLLAIANLKRININAKIVDSNIVIADKKKVSQVIANLLGNAIKFSNLDSDVELFIYDVLEPRPGIMIEVRDFGLGIPKEDHGLIFESFYQVSRGLQRTFQGTGLGLALVKNIVDLHCGEIRLDSTPGKGSLFSVFFPSLPDISDNVE